MALGKQLLTVMFTVYFLVSIIGAGLITNAVFNSTDDGNKRTISLSDTEITYSKIFLILYMISTLPMLILFFTVSNK